MASDRRFFGLDLWFMRSRRARWVLIASVALCASEVPSVSFGAVGGTPVGVSMYLGTGALVKKRFGSPIIICTATVIAPRALITAAHCVADSSALPLDFTLDASVTNAHQSASVSVRRVYVNPAYALRANGPTHDIALVELDEPLEGVVLERVLDPADAITVLHQGIHVELVGYGSTGADGWLLGERNAAEATITRVGANEMTIGAPGEPQSCHGDSGAPAFLVDADGTRRIVGIASRSANDATECVNGSINIRVDAYVDWIVATLRAIDLDFQRSKRGEGRGAPGCLGCG